MKLAPFVVLIITLVSCCSYAFPQEENELKLRSQWAEFKKKHNKSYSSQLDDQFRFELWLKNLEFIQEHNKAYEEGRVTFFVAQNHFSDLTKEERAAYSGFDPRKMRESLANHTLVDEASFPIKLTAAEVDWRAKGAVNPVKNQGNCRSCWAFAAVACIEGQHFMRTGQLVSLSEQQIVDCISNTNCGSGGYPHWAFSYLTRNSLEPSITYPYTGFDRLCQHDPLRGVTKLLIGSHDIPYGNELILQAVVSQAGPVAMALNTKPDAFGYYAGGIFSLPPQICGNTLMDLDHAMAIVGYGTDQNGQQYYTVRNSWGEHWGEQGYIRIARNHGNVCGVASAATVPVFYPKEEFI